MTEELELLAEKVNWEDPDSVIDFYEDNSIVFSDFKSIDDENFIIDLINIKCHYVYSLIGKGRFTKAKEYIADIDILNQKIKHKQDLYNKYEEEKEFYLGIIYGRLKNYSESAIIFNRLIKVDPENDNYKNWYTEMRKESVNKQTMGLGIIGLIIISGDIVLKRVFDIILNDYVFIVGLSLVVISVIFPHAYRFWIKNKINKKKAHNTGS